MSPLYSSIDDQYFSAPDPGLELHQCLICLGQFKFLDLGFDFHVSSEFQKFRQVPSADIGHTLDLLKKSAS